MTRSELPDAKTLVRDVQEMDLDLDIANTEDEKRELEDQKMSKTWRALRLMSKTKLNLFDKVDDGRNLECFLQNKEEAAVEGEEAIVEKSVEGESGEGSKEEDEPMRDEEVKPETDAAITITTPQIVVD